MGKQQKILGYVRISTTDQNSCGFPMGEVQVADGIVICPNCGRFKKVLIKKGKATVSDPDEKELMNSRLMRYLISIGLVIILD
ncbi:hypothetical protein QYZ88_016065 [Lachnospiraceae bacterium C1.1]|nr:hypothetical protein [Lachnospiraceae bacterium C1.1]